MLLAHQAPRLSFRTAVRSAAIVLALWIAFFGMQVVLSILLARRSAGQLAFQLEIDLVVAVLWATLSFLIARWHRFARGVAPGVLSLVALHLPTMALAAIADTAVTRFTMAAADPSRAITPFWALLVYYVDFDLVSYVAIIVVAEVLLVRRALQERQRLATRLESSLSRARLEYLEAQLHPHFLFNSLGAVAELAYDAPAAARRVLGQLASVFRTALARRTTEVTLGEELLALEPYLDIQRIRFADWLTIEYHIDESAVDCLLPPLLLQPLVENAIRHGLRGRSAPGMIEIAARVEGDTLVVRVADNGVGMHRSAEGGHGIGLANVRDRLEIMYGADDRLRLMAAEGDEGGTVAELRIPARKQRLEAYDANPDGAQPRAPVASKTELRTLPVPRPLRSPVVATGVVWLLCGLVWTQQSYVYLALRGRLGDASWWSLARMDLVSALIWAVVTPLVIRLSARFPMQRRGLPARVLVYLAAGACVDVFQVAAVRLLTSGSVAGPSTSWQLPLIVNFAIYCVLVTVGHRGALVGWLRAREEAAAELTAAVARAQARADGVQAIPPMLVTSLDEIAQSMDHDPQRTEQHIARLADSLRAVLDASRGSGGGDRPGPGTKNGPAAAPRVIPGVL